MKSLDLVLHYINFKGNVDMYLAFEALKVGIIYYQTLELYRKKQLDEDISLLCGSHSYEYSISDLSKTKKTAIKQPSSGSGHMLLHD